MRRDRQGALKLRLAGKSYTEIQSALGVPKSTLSGWFSNLLLPDKVKERILLRTQQKSLAGLLKRNRDQTPRARKRSAGIRRVAAREVPAITRDGLFFTGCALYWAEGYKRLQIRNGREVTYHPVSLTNSDPALVQTFLRFLREICRVPEEKIRADIRIYKHHNETNLLNFWIRVTNIPRKNFGRTYYGISKSSIGKRPYNRLPYGTIQVRVNDTQLFHKIMGWIEGVRRVIGAS